MPHHDICILGAGPGGATAALHLANAGHRLPAAGPRRLPARQNLRRRPQRQGHQRVEAHRARPARQAGRRRPCRFPAGASTSSPPTAASSASPSSPSSTKPPTTPPATSPSASTSIISWSRKCGSAPKSTSAKTWTWPVPSAPKAAGSSSTKAGQLIATCRLLLVANGAQSAFARQVAGHALEPNHHCAGLRTYYDGVSGLSPDNFIELHFIKDFPTRLPLGFSAAQRAGQRGRGHALENRGRQENQPAPAPR